MTGFRKPHAPWEYPQRMWDLYTDAEIATAEFDTLGAATPQVAWSNQLGVTLENGTSFAYSPAEARHAAHEPHAQCAHTHTGKSERARPCEGRAREKGIEMHH